jgi:hypothetical protein
MQPNVYSPLYTNEVSSEYLRELDRPHHLPDKVATFHPDTQAQVRANEAHVKAHPAIGIFRVATQGSQTRDGAVIMEGSLPLEFTLPDKRKVRSAKVGDYAIYPDGTKAQIVTGAGEANSQMALVGSRLSNGDEIINTPENRFVLIAREGLAMDDDFLPAFEA